MTTGTVEREITANQWRWRVTRHLNLWIAIVIVVTGTVVSWFRLPPSARDTLWAEDARNFLANALTEGPVSPLFQSYAGYLHTLPRVIAGVTVSTVPVQSWALAMTAGSCFVAACVAALVFFCSRDVVDHVAARLALAAVTLLVPTSPREVLGNTANLHWYFLWLAPWLLTYRPRSRVESWILAGVGLLAALTEIQMVFFAPLLLLRWRDKGRIPVRAFYLGGIALQLAATVLRPRKASAATLNSWASVAYGYLINSVMTIWIPGSKNIGHLLVLFGPAAALVCALPFAAAIAWVMMFGSRRQKATVTLLAASSVLVFVVAIRTTPGVYYNYATESLASLANPWTTRYGVVPSMDLLATVVIALTVRAGPPPGHTSALRSNAPRTVVGAILLGVVLVQFIPASTRRETGPEFSPQVTAAARHCLTRPTTTPITFYSPPGIRSWKIHSTCALVEPVSP